MIYVAYGSNLNMGQMAMRCPQATVIGGMMLQGWRLVFRGVADIIPDSTCSVPVGLWKITDECEAALDIYEGFPRLYRKEYIQEGDMTLMAYVMNNDSLTMPTRRYLDSIADGYKDFNFDSKSLIDALKFTSDNKRGEGHTPKRYAI